MRFIVIGGIASRVHGSPTVTVDLDICYERSRANLLALAETLQELHATLRGVDPALPVGLDARALGLGDTFTLETSEGPLDCLATPTGTEGFADLARDATSIELAGVPVMIASLDALMRMKLAAGRPKDRIELEILEALRQERAGNDPG